MKTVERSLVHCWHTIGLLRLVLREKTIWYIDNRRIVVGLQCARFVLPSQFLILWAMQRTTYICLQAPHTVTALLQAMNKKI